MISTQAFNHISFQILAVVHSMQHNVQEWIRKEIVDDDPYDQETFFPKNNN